MATDFSISPNVQPAQVEKVARFVLEHFELRRCQRYVKVDLETDKDASNGFLKPDDCVCGRSVDWHLKNKVFQKRVAPLNEPWSPQRDTTPHLCTSFGQLTFAPGEGCDPSTIVPGASANYVRLVGKCNDPAYMEHVYKLMTDKGMWSLPVPQLLIEVTGIATTFPHVDQRVLDKFNSGLISAAKTANAWIVTGGTNCGVMGLVGDAVSKSRMTQRDKGITCLGIAPWGIVNHRDKLNNFETVENENGETGPKTLTKGLNAAIDFNIGNVTPGIRSRQKLEGVIRQINSQNNPWSPAYVVERQENCEDGVPLNSGHNCFLFVDNGLEKRFGEEINFRAQFLHYLSRKTIRGTGGMAVSRTPLVLLVVGGGSDTLKTVEISIRSSWSTGEAILDRKPVSSASESSSLATMQATEYDHRDRQSPLIGLETTISTVASSTPTQTPSDPQAEPDHQTRPVVILSGFGGTSDLLAFAYAISAPMADKDRHFYGHLQEIDAPAEQSDIPADFDERLRRHPAFAQILRRVPLNQRAGEEEITIKRIRNCLKSRSMMTVVNLHDENEFVPLDHAILNAIFKSHFASPEATFELAQLWNRSDVAKRLLGRFEVEIRSRVDMKAALTRSIMYGQFEFFRLLVEYNLVDLHSYLTLAQIRAIYSEIFIRRRGKAGKATCVWLFRSLLMNATTDETLSDVTNPKMLEHIGSVLSGLLGCYLDNVFTEEKSYLASDDPDNKDSLSAQFGKLVRPYETSLRDLFILQLLLHRNDLAVYVWKLGHDHLGSALMASVFLKSLSREANRLDMTDLGHSFVEQASEWLQRSICLLSSCYDQEPMMCYHLLTRALVTWQGCTLLEMAFYGNKKRFMEHPAVQTALSQVWLGQMATFTRPSLIYLTMFPLFLPFLIFRIRFEEGSSRSSTTAANGKTTPTTSNYSLFLRFFGEIINRRAKVADSGLSPSPESAVSEQNGCVGCVPCHRSQDARTDVLFSSPVPAVIKKPSAFPAPTLALHDVKFTKASLFDFNKEGRISVFKAMYLLYTSPIAKYVVHSLALVTFLLLFSYFVLDGIHKDDISIVEMTLWLCCGIYFLDIVRDGFGKESLSFIERCQDFFFNVWVLVDIICVLIVIIAVAMRLSMSWVDFVYAHTAYATACVVYWLKSLRIFFITESVGPKVFTLFKMLRDLSFFILIYLILLLSFSMPIYALLYPDSQIDDTQSYLALIIQIAYDRMWNVFVVGLDDARRIIEGTCRFQNYTDPIVIVQTRHPALFDASNLTTPAFTPLDYFNVTSYANNISERFQFITNGTILPAMSSALDSVDPGDGDTILFQGKARSVPNPNVPNCSSRNIVAIILYIIYLLLTNIVLLNMLIAMFAHTVDKTRLSATRLWRFDMYRFLFEYYTRPVLPVPLMAFELIYRFCIYLYRHISGKLEPENNDLKQFFPGLDDFEYRKLEMFERSAVETALAEASKERRNSDKTHQEQAVVNKLHHVQDRLHGKMESVEARLAEVLDEMGKLSKVNVKSSHGSKDNSH